VTIFFNILKRQNNIHFTLGLLVVIDDMETIYTPLLTFYIYHFLYTPLFIYTTFPQSMRFHERLLSQTIFTLAEERQFAILNV